MEKKKVTFYYIGAFLVFFLLYHAAEYFAMFVYQPIIFLGFHISFLLAAYILGKVQHKNGFKTWGLQGRKFLWVDLVVGGILGFLLYMIPFLICLAIGIEIIISFPSFSEFWEVGVFMFFGLFFSSISEDILTRGVLYGWFQKSLHPITLVLFSSLIFYLNHIYRLNEGLSTFFYLFLLGIILYMTILITKRLWLSVMMHWIGNCTFYATHQIIQVKEVHANFGFNHMFICTEMVFIMILSIILIFKYQKVKRPEKTLSGGKEMA
jgi:membrane protease YdiL (CAAX protease family)